MGNRQFLLEMMPKDSICAEIGVARGNFSQKILDVVKPKLLYLVDPWQYDPVAEAANRFYGGKAGSQTAMDEVALSVYRRFEDNKVVQIWRSRSDRFFPETTDEYFDWVYIDGNHDFGPCLVDIILAINKVKVGGYVCGDDVNWGKKELNKPVHRACGVIMNHEPRLKIGQFENAAGKKLNFKNNQFVFKRVK